jgi:hypothetical protein
MMANPAAAADQRPNWIPSLPWRKPKPAEPTYDEADVDALRRLRFGLAHLETLLADADLAARRLVNAPNADGKFAQVQSIWPKPPT